MVPGYFKREAKLMGNHFELSVVADNREWAEERIDEGISEIRRIEKLFTTFSEDSVTNLINRMAGIEPVKVSEEFFDLVERSIRISSLTQGAFDLTYGSIDKRFWNFDVGMESLPDKKLAKQSVGLINYRNIILDRNELTVWLKNKGMRIGFGGIGKGYAADRAKKIMVANGVTSGIVNASGDLITWGRQPGGGAWTVGIAHPDMQELPFSYLDISDSAVATSGNYEKFVLIGGKKYSHTIDPRTGFPVTGIKSVTVFAQYAELCDALATPVTVMGVEKGLALINQLQQVECVIIDDDNNLFVSSNIKITR